MIVAFWFASHFYFILYITLLSPRRFDRVFREFTFQVSSLSLSLFSLFTFIHSPSFLLHTLVHHATLLFSSVLAIVWLVHVSSSSSHFNRTSTSTTTSIIHTHAHIICDHCAPLSFGSCGNVCYYYLASASQIVRLLFFFFYYHYHHFNDCHQNVFCLVVFISIYIYIYRKRGICVLTLSSNWNCTTHNSRTINGVVYDVIVFVYGCAPLIYYEIISFWVFPKAQFYIVLLFLFYYIPWPGFELFVPRIHHHATTLRLQNVAYQVLIYLCLTFRSTNA